MPKKTLKLSEELRNASRKRDVRPANNFDGTITDGGELTTASLDCKFVVQVCARVKCGFPHSAQNIDVLNATCENL